MDKDKVPFQKSIFYITYQVSHKKVYAFEANLVIIEFKSLAYLSNTIG